MTGVSIGSLYKHFKGGIYRVIDTAIHTETGEKLVIYMSVDTGIVYARPFDMFVSKVDKDKYPGVKQEYRFIRIPE
jgi:hypothetical protein